MNVVLVEPEIPPNTGNVARLCAATGAVLHLVGPLGFRLTDKELKRAGMDYWEQVTWKYWDSFAALQRAAGTAARFWFVETNARRRYSEARFEWGDYLVFGCETKGLPADLLTANVEQTISIPMRNPQARSLNLATAVAVVLYEVVRQTNPTWGASA